MIKSNLYETDFMITADVSASIIDGGTASKNAAN